MAIDNRAADRVRPAQQEPGRLLAQCLPRIVTEKVDSAQILAGEIPGLERRGQITGVRLVELVGATPKCHRQMSGEIPDRPWRAPASEGPERPDQLRRTGSCAISAVDQSSAMGQGMTAGG